jgi:hypothetical protein
MDRVPLRREVCAAGDDGEESGFKPDTFAPHTPYLHNPPGKIPVHEYLPGNSGMPVRLTMAKINVLDREVGVIVENEEDYICITDIARYRNAENTDDLIRSWLRNRNTVEFLGIWEQLNNPDFNPVQFNGFRKQAGLNSFTLTPKQWIEMTHARGIKAKPGRYGGTYAHKDIAFEFASWISVEFKLYLIKEFQRLKEDEHRKLGWDIRRNLAKINYRIHTDAIKENLIPAELNPAQINRVYASEADLLNMALFGSTAREWRDSNPDKKGNIRDYADISQLVCLSNLENLNAHFIGENIPQPGRLAKLNAIAIHQMTLLTADMTTRLISGGK